MGLRLKTAALTTSIFVALLVAVYSLFSIFILREFAAIERERMAINYQRLSEAVHSVQEDLLLRAQEWGLWDDSYNYIINPTDEFIEINFEGLPFELTDVIFINKQGKKVFAGRFEAESKKFRPIPSDLEAELIQSPRVQELIKSDIVGSFSGFIRSGSNPTILSAASISDTSGEKAPIGVILFTRDFGPETQLKIAKQVRMLPRFELLPVGFVPSDNGNGSSLNVSITNGDRDITAAGIINDLNGAPLVQSSFTMPREIYSQGRTALNNVMGVLVMFLLVANCLTLIFLNRAVMDPLKNLSALMQLITTSGDLGIRVGLRRRDEIGLLGESFDSLISNTQNSYGEMLKAQRAAENANSGKSLFIAKVSHELRTPIHCITGMLRILLKQEAQSGKRQYIQMAQDSADGLLSTINEILDFSKMESGELALESYEFNLPNTIRGCVQALIPRFEEKHGIELSWDVAPGIPENVIGDSHRLRNIFTNLLGNAFKFTERGAVTFKAMLYEAQLEGRTGVRFEISDSGIGIPEDRLAHIFDPFTQADDSTARLYGGSGLGLAIVKQIVEQMGGRVAVESVVGKGSTFIVEVPFELVGEGVTGVRTGAAKARTVALLARNTEGTALLVHGLQRYGIHCEVFPPQDPQSFNVLSTDLSSYDMVINSGSIEAIGEELVPIINSARAAKVPFLMSVPSCEMALTDRWERSDAYFLIQKPLSALDVSLILEGRAIATAAAMSAEESESMGHSLHILIADDAPTNRIILTNLLEEAGHTVEVVDNGKKMVDKMRKSIKGIALGHRPFDLVMTDIQMPIMDGLTAAQKIRDSERELEVIKAIPIVAVTAYTFPGEAAKMRTAGIDHILTKPISPKKLALLITEISEKAGFSGGNRPNISEESGEDREDLELIAELCRITTHVSNAVIAERGPILGEDSMEALQAFELPIDIKDVFERSGNSLRRTNLILSGFLSAYKDPMDWLENMNLASASPSDVRRATHSLKGLLLDVGAVSAAALAGSLEEQIVIDPKSLDLAKMSTLLSQVKMTAVLLESLVGELPKGT